MSQKSEKNGMDFTVPRPRARFHLYRNHTRLSSPTKINGQDRSLYKKENTLLYRFLQTFIQPNAEVQNHYFGCVNPFINLYRSKYYKTIMVIVCSDWTYGSDRIKGDDLYLIDHTRYLGFSLGTLYWRLALAVKEPCEFETHKRATKNLLIVIQTSSNLKGIQS